MKSRIGLAALILCIGLLLMLRGLIANLWLSWTDSDYRVPAQSSYFSFTPTVMNSGSGGWWDYGEDGHYFYHFTGGTPSYRAISRDAAARCAAFNRHDVNSWC